MLPHQFLQELFITISPFLKYCLPFIQPGERTVQYKIRDTNCTHKEKMRDKSSCVGLGRWYCLRVLGLPIKVMDATVS